MNHVASEPSPTYELLKSINDAFFLNIQIQPDDSIQCNRSLDGSIFAGETGIKPKSWQIMVEELAGDWKRYDV